MDGQFAQKARLVVDEHKTDAPSILTFVSVVSCESVCLAFLIAGLNGLKIWSADTHGMCLNAPCWEKCWMESKAEFGHAEKGCAMIVAKALHGLKSSGVAGREFLQKPTINGMKFKCTHTDPCVHA